MLKMLLVIHLVDIHAHAWEYLFFAISDINFLSNGKEARKSLYAFEHFIGVFSA